MPTAESPECTELLNDVTTVLEACRVRLRGTKVAVAEYYVARPEVTQAMRRLVRAVRLAGLDADLLMEPPERPDGIFADSTAPID